MKNIMGPPVEGKDFYGRTTESTFAWQMIENGNNLQLAAPRRVGKTSFALHLLDLARKKGWQTISMNLEKISTEHQFIELFVEQLTQLSWWEKTKDRGAKFIDYFSQVKPSISFQEVKVELTWENKKQDVYKQLAKLLEHSENTLIFFDEITVLLTSLMDSCEEGKTKVRSLLHWLRDIRITPSSKIRWILCSSVGIENFTHKHAISDTLNDVHKFSLRSFSENESINMLTVLAESHKLALSNSLSKAIVKKLDYCIPYFLQVLFGKINYLVVVEAVPLNDAIIDSAYSALTEENHFNTWIERIQEQYTEDAAHTFLMLKHLCQVKGGAKRDNLVNLLVAIHVEPTKADEICSRLLYMLQNDGYLLEEDELYRFRSPLLRDFWYNRFVK